MAPLPVRRTSHTLAGALATGTGNSLFGTLKAERLIFANPTRGIRVGRRNPSVPAPLPAHLLAETAAAARDDPAVRVGRSPWSACTRCCPARSATCAWTRSTWPAEGLTPAG